MMDKILTISIASYNVEEYIRRNIDSIISSGCIDDIELIAVDDGGTDQTLSILREYEKRYPDSVRAVHKENGGYGSTVNYSIANAKGKYFKILDGDDWMDPEGLNRLVYVLKHCDEDAFVTEYTRFRDGEETPLSPCDKTEWPESGRVSRVSALPHQTYFTMWELTIKTEILHQSGIVFPQGVLYTDHYFGTVPFIAVKSVRILDFPVYCYRIGRDGQSISKESRIKHVDDALWVCEDLCKFTSQQTANENYGYLRDRTTITYTHAIKTLLILPINRANLDKLKQYEARIKRIAPDVFADLTQYGKAGRLMKFIRGTGYAGYWLLKLIPGGLPNFG